MLSWRALEEAPRITVQRLFIAQTQPGAVDKRTIATLARTVSIFSEGSVEPLDNMARHASPGAKNVASSLATARDCSSGKKCPQ